VDTELAAGEGALMPLKSFICPDREEIECSKCIAENGCRMEQRCCARPVLKLMSQTERVWKGIPSTTQLLKGTMEAFLMLVHDFAVSPDKLAFIINGSGTHKMLEEQGDEISKAELDYSDERGSIRPDLIETEGGKNILIDYKITGSFAVAKAQGIYFEDVPVLGEDGVQLRYKTGQKKGKLKTRKERRVDPKLADVRDWALQLNNYRVGIERGEILQGPDGRFYAKATAPKGSKKIKIHAIRVQALVRDGGTVVAISRGVERNVYLIDIPKVPDQDIKDYFKRKRDDLLQAMKDGHWETPCNDLERWNDRKCTDFCNVKRFCPYWINKYSQNVDQDKLADADMGQIGDDGCPNTTEEGAE
jgi:hypothetical protein